MAILADLTSDGGTSRDEDHDDDHDEGQDVLADRERSWLTSLRDALASGASDRTLLALVDAYAVERFATVDRRLPVRPARAEPIAPRAAPVRLFARPDWTAPPGDEDHLDLDTILQLGLALDGEPTGPAPDPAVDPAVDADLVWVYDPPAWLDPDRVQVIDLNAIEAAHDVTLTPLLPFGVGVPADEDWWVLNEPAAPSRRRGR